MNLREPAGAERAARINRLVSVPRPIDRISGAWLACYPIFQDALVSGETTFGALPDYAKSVALRRTSIDMAEQAIASKALDEVHVSLIELCTQSVSEAVEDYLRGENHDANTLLDGFTASQQSLSEQPAPDSYRFIGRPPCLLRPGRHVFIDGWMRFFTYQSRGDLSIPLLAVDWLDFHGRLERLLPVVRSGRR